MVDREAAGGLDRVPVVQCPRQRAALQRAVGEHGQLPGDRPADRLAERPGRDRGGFLQHLEQDAVTDDSDHGDLGQTVADLVLAEGLRLPVVHHAHMGCDADIAVRARCAVALDFGGVVQAGGEFWDQARDRGDEIGRQLEAGMQFVWRTDKTISDAWMRGKIDTRQVLARMGIDLARPGIEDRLLQELDASIAALPVDAGLVQLVSAWRARAIVVLATDNVRAFQTVFRQAQTGEGGGLTLAGIAPLFDGIICSASEGCLKSDPPAGGFFRSWAARNALAPGDILLVDDREANCAAWRQADGAAVRWELRQDLLGDLGRAVSGWLDRREQARPAATA